MPVDSDRTHVSRQRRELIDWQMSLFSLIALSRYAELLKCSMPCYTASRSKPNCEIIAYLQLWSICLLHVCKLLVKCIFKHLLVKIHCIYVRKCSAIPLFFSSCCATKSRCVHMHCICRKSTGAYRQNQIPGQFLLPYSSSHHQTQDSWGVKTEMVLMLYHKAFLGQTRWYLIKIKWKLGFF